MTTLKFDKHLSSSAADVSVKFQSDAIIQTTSQLQTSQDLTIRRLMEYWNGAQFVKCKKYTVLYMQCQDSFKQNLHPYESYH